MTERDNPTAEEVACFSVDQKTGIANVFLNRTRCLNAINVALLIALVSCLRKAQTLKCKVCILSGFGTSFCSGEDLKETLAPQSDGKNLDELRLAFEQLQDITRLMTGADTVFISAVKGWAIGGGAAEIQIAFAADVVVASPDAKFKFPEITHGHAPTGGITGRLPQLIGLQHAERLMLFGESITAAEALSLNMVTEVANDPVSRSSELALQLSQKSGRSLASIKKGLEKATFPDAETTYKFEVEAASWCFADVCASGAIETFRRRKIEYTTADLNVGTTLPSLLQKNYSAHPDKAFLRFGSIDVTYADFAKNVSRLASGLLSAGIQEGDVIAAMMINSEEMVRFWFAACAAMSTGAIWAPLPCLTLRRALELVGPKLMIVDEAFLVHLPTDIDLRPYVRPRPVPTWVEEFERRFGLKIYEVYGSTETGLPIVQPVDQPRVKGSWGVALKGVDLRIINDDGSDAKPGTVGELLICQPVSSQFSGGYLPSPLFLYNERTPFTRTRLTGYYKNAEATSNSLRDGWFHSGDLCQLDSEGNLFFVGRRKHVIRRRGENISAFAVEEALLMHPDVLECAAYGVPSLEFTEEDLAVSIVSRMDSDLTEREVYKFAVRTMAKFQVPRYIGFLDALPCTNG